MKKPAVQLSQRQVQVVVSNPNAAQSNGRPVCVQLPGGGFVGFMPLIACSIICGIEIAVALVDLIRRAFDDRELPSAVFPPATIQFHLSWGIVLSLALAFIEDSLKHQLNRGCCNFITTILALLCAFFIIVSLYIWLWANDEAGIVMICKLAAQMKFRMSPEKIRLYIYTDNIKYSLDCVVSWVFPIQCILVTLDAFFAMFQRTNVEQIPIQVKSMGQVNVVRLDGRRIYKVMK